MIICANCGVELEDGFSVCPLCGRSPLKKSEPEPKLMENNPSGIIRLQRKDNLRHLWELSAIIAFSAIAVCTIVDLLTSNDLGWSLITDLSISATWIIMTTFLFAGKNPLVIIPSLMITTLVTLFFIDLMSPRTEWFYPAGLPVTIVSFMAACTIILVYRRSRLKGLNIIASSLIVLSGLCIIIELILDQFLKGSVYLRWSLIAGISILPVSLIIVYYHYRLKKGNRLDSFFHI